MALYIPTAAEIKKILQAWQIHQVTDGSSFVAPTIYLLKGVTNVPRWNYYNSKETALKQLYYLSGEKGFTAQTANGSVDFKKDGTAQTLGINVDFYLPVSVLSNVPVNYFGIKEVLKTKLDFFLIRFYKTNGSGPYYAAINKNYFGVSAQVVKATGEKLAAIETFYRNLARIKAEYNSLVSSLNMLTAQPFNAKTQETINRLTQRRISMDNEIRQISGINIVTGPSGTISGIGIVPILYIVVLAVIGVAGWTVSTWLNEKAKTQRIVDAYNHQQFIAAEQKQLLADYKAGKIPEAVFINAAKNLGIAMETAKKVAEESSKPDKGLLDGVGNIVMWLAIGVIGMQALKR